MPVDPVIGTTLGLLGGFIGKIGQRKQQRRNIRDQTAANKELAEYAYGKDLEQWERQNAYNLPTAQMGRLKEAGLNPKLMYGSGSSAGVGVTPSKSPQYQTVRADFSKRQSPLMALDMMGAFQDFAMKNAQIDKARAEADSAQQFYYFRARDQGWKSRQRGQEYKYGVRMEPGETRSNLYRFKDYQLQMKEQQVRQYKTGANLRQMEIDWFEAMKKLGIGKAMVLPMMRMMMGR